MSFRAQRRTGFADFVKDAESRVFPNQDSSLRSEGQAIPALSVHDTKTTERTSLKLLIPCLQSLDIFWTNGRIMAWRGTDSPHRGFRGLGMRVSVPPSVILAALQSLDTRFLSEACFYLFPYAHLVVRLPRTVNTSRFITA